LISVSTLQQYESCSVHTHIGIWRYSWIFS
jgi:hypothetical protein